MHTENILLPEKVEFILDTLEHAGYEAYAVGGCIRDSILGRKPKDWDITTSAMPKEVKALFSKTIDTGIQHGTVTVLIGRDGFEVTTYRIDGAYEDSRHPKEVTFTPNLIEDLKRRDFTINAMAYHKTKGLVDAFDGVRDLKQGVVRCVGDARERFLEDALRMMRAVRFAAQLGFSIAEGTREAICELSANLERISAERIQMELVKILVSDHPQEIRTLYETGITRVVLPEFDAMMETEQKNPHHRYCVGEHVIAGLLQIENDKVLRLAMLFHDIAKPICQTLGEDGFHHFYGHPERGKIMTEQILRRLKFDNDTIVRVCRLVASHDVNPEITQKSVRKAMVKAGLEAYPKLFSVKRADILAQSDYLQKEKLEYLKEYEACYQEILKEKQSLTLKELAVTGKDLIGLGICPGPRLGKILNELFWLVVEEPEKNEKDILLERAKALSKGEFS